MEAYWPTLFSGFLAKAGIEKLILAASSGGGGGGGGGGGDGGGAADEPAAEEKKEEEEEEEVCMLKSIGRVRFFTYDSLRSRKILIEIGTIIPQHSVVFNVGRKSICIVSRYTVGVV